MILIDKCINRIIWLINALKEHNKLTNQDISFKMGEKVFMLNKNFQKYFYSFNLYLKLFNRFEKGFNYLLKSKKLNKHSLANLKNTYLNRAAIYFKEAGQYLKLSKNEIGVPSKNFYFLYSSMKSISATLMALENDSINLINDLY